ncbi:MAG: hypothetical protein ABIX46_01185 [Burkholderiaceae bacterium]
MGEDFRDHRLFLDRGDDLQLAPAGQAVFKVEIEHPPEQLDPAQSHWAVMRAACPALGVPRPGRVLSNRAAWAGGVKAVLVRAWAK